MINFNDHAVIATRELYYAPIGEATTRRMKICISQPYLLTDEAVGSEYDSGVAGCDIGFDGLNEKGDTIYGADTLQALVLALDSMESYLFRLRKKYDFYFPNGDLYFDN